MYLMQLFAVGRLEPNKREDLASAGGVAGAPARMRKRWHLPADPTQMRAGAGGVV